MAALVAAPEEDALLDRVARLHRGLEPALFGVVRDGRGDTSEADTARAPAQLLREDMVQALCVHPHGGRTALPLLPRLARLLGPGGAAAAHPALAVPILQILRRVARHSAELAGEDGVGGAQGRDAALLTLSRSFLQWWWWWWWWALGRCCQRRYWQKTSCCRA